MHLDDLRNFVHIVESGSYRAASVRAHLSQPALTASMQRLEAEFGAALLHRGRAGARVTACGEALLSHARLALANVEDGRRAVAEVAGLQRGSVRIGAGSTGCIYLLPPLLAQFRSVAPGVRLFVREAPNDDLWAMLATGALDLAVVTDLEPQHHDGLDVEPWRVDELVVVAAPGRDARTLPWLSFGPNAAVRRVQDQLVPGATIEMELDSISAIKGYTRAGLGKALISNSALVRDLADGGLQVVPMPGTPYRRQLVLAHRGAAGLSPSAQALRKLLLDARVPESAATTPLVKARRGTRTS